eukprot:CAMPEP_0115882310 /NCGR_PEP_ID=MMETSP0287-20121206/28934_1 /TAXON_ID=412157 /ORGANISM="Chrysochromulina rotalis, Strain UIO044" /LENGTH=34 /DNA_ID= /DNA_START= /DNA_END= /DNA_ORIENTATION=
MDACSLPDADVQTADPHIVRTLCTRRSSVLTQAR